MAYSYTYRKYFQNLYSIKSQGDWYIWFIDRKPNKKLLFRDAKLFEENHQTVTVASHCHCDTHMIDDHDYVIMTGFDRSIGLITD